MLSFLPLSDIDALEDTVARTPWVLSEEQDGDRVFASGVYSMPIEAYPDTITVGRGDIFCFLQAPNTTYKILVPPRQYRPIPSVLMKLWRRRLRRHRRLYPWASALMMDWCRAQYPDHHLAMGLFLEHPVDPRLKWTNAIQRTYWEHPDSQMFPVNPWNALSAHERLSWMPLLEQLPQKISDLLPSSVAAFDGIG